jgi:NAD(P)-dependent dehydrogenase (short-subunit alcohol dehydrogenase family)
MAQSKKTAVITGAAGGIGRATVRVFAAAGWEVIGLDRQPGGEFPEGARCEQVDVSSPAQVEAFFAQLGGTHRQLHALVNNAAISMDRPLTQTTPEDWDTVQASNLRSVYLTSRGAYPLLRAAPGAIINVSSVHALATSINVAAYAASKGGMLALTRAMALEFGPDGIRVNVVLPGAVDTQMLRSGLGRGHLSGASIEQKLQELARRTVLGRVGDPEEIAQAILFLADEKRASFITGQALVVDGGATARLSTE